MNYKKQIKIISLLFVTYLILLATYLIVYQNDFCSGINDCLKGMIFGAPYQYSVLPVVSLFLCFFVSLFVKEAAYLSWRKFALWYLPIVTILIFVVGGTGSSGFNPGMGFDRESLTFFFSGLFVFISLILITYKSIKLRGK
jgi:hypothetical protein